MLHLFLAYYSHVQSRERQIKMEVAFQDLILFPTRKIELKSYLDETDLNYVHCLSRGARTIVQRSPWIVMTFVKSWWRNVGPL